MSTLEPELTSQPIMTNKIIEEFLGSLVRDITAAGFMSKSECRRRLAELVDKAIDQQKAEIAEKIIARHRTLMGEDHQDCGHQWAEAYKLGQRMALVNTLKILD